MSKYNIITCDSRYDSKDFVVAESGDTYIQLGRVFSEEYLTITNELAVAVAEKIIEICKPKVEKTRKLQECMDACKLKAGV